MNRWQNSRVWVGVALAGLAVAGLALWFLRQPAGPDASREGAVPKVAIKPLPEACLRPAQALTAGHGAAARAVAARKEPSAAVRKAVGETSSVSHATARNPTERESYQDRLMAIKSLGSRLPEAEIERLMAFLKDPATAREGNLWDLGLKNETLLLLMRQERFPQGLTSLLAGIVQDGNQDLTWRDYALQFVPVCAARTQGRASEDDASIRAALSLALQAQGTVLRGTALLAMQRLSDGSDIYKRDEVAASARSILSQSDRQDPSRITAIQVLACSGDAEGLAVARRIGRDETSPILERMSAIGALGSVGTPEDLAWLRDMAQRPGVDKRLKTAAEYNVKQLARSVAKAGL